VPAIALALLALTAAAYAPLARNEFILVDDYTYIVNNEHLRGGVTLASLRWAFTASHASNWHPLTWISHMVDFRLFGFDARGPHLVNLLLHAAGAALLFAVARAMTGSLWRSALFAALLAVHPLRVESVAWAACRKDVLSGLFWVLALGAHLRYARRPGVGRYLLLLGLFSLGLLSKPTVVTLPFALLLLDFWPLGRLAQGGAGGPRLAGRAARLALEKVPLLLLSAAASLATYRVQESTGAMAFLRDLPVAARAANALLAYVAYLRQTVWPQGLAVFYPQPAAPPPAWQPLGALLLLGAVTAAALFAVRRRPWLATGWFWYLGTLVPMIGLVQVGGQARADRYTYLPLMGVFLLAVWGASEPALRRRALRPVVAGAAIAVVTALAVACRAQAGLWRDTLTLFTHADAVTERNWMAQNNIGAALANRGELERALPHFRRALVYRPGYPEANDNVHRLMIDLGRLKTTPWRPAGPGH
jgi:hypothetical protein